MSKDEFEKDVEELEAEALEFIFSQIDASLLDNKMISKRKLRKIAKKASDKKLQAFDKAMSDACFKVAITAYKLFILMASNPQVKLTTIALERDGDSIELRPHVGVVEVIDGEGVKMIINPALIKKIEFVGGESNGDQES